MGKLLAKNIFLVVIVVLAFVFRIYKITENPPSLNWDEVSIGYNAYSIYKTGRDEWGQFLPLHFKAYGEYKLPAQVYFSIPGIVLFGLSPLGVRVTPVIYGTLTVALIYFLSKELFKSRTVGLVSSFLLAISPWHIHLTRASFESSFSVFWVVLGVWLMLKAFKNSKWIILSALSFVVGIYTYNSARVFIPLFLLVVFLIYRKDYLRDRKRFLLSVVVFFMLLIPLIPFSLSGEVANRYKLVSILDDPGLVPRIEEARNLSTLPQGIVPFVHNRVTYTSFYFLRNYFSHFNPDFLFVNGAPHKQHHVQGVGQMYLIQAPFVLLGVYFLFKNKQKYRWLVIAWVLLAFVPVSITRDSIPHALRTIIAVAPYQILTAYGFIVGVSLSRKSAIKKVIVGLTALTLGLNFMVYLNKYYNEYSVAYSRDWQYGYREVVSYIKDHYEQYDKVVFTRHYGEPHMFTLFFLEWDPKKYQTDSNLNRFETFDWVRVLTFDKFYFPDLGDEGTKYEDIVKQNPEKKLLFIGKPGDFPNDLARLMKVDFLNGKGAFEIVEHN